VARSVGRVDSGLCHSHAPGPDACSIPPHCKLRCRGLEVEVNSLNATATGVAQARACYSSDSAAAGAHVSGTNNNDN
jgi:hypothetical protein